MERVSRNNSSLWTYGILSIGLLGILRFLFRYHELRNGIEIKYRHILFGGGDNRHDGLTQRDKCQFRKEMVRVLQLLIADRIKG